MPKESKLKTNLNRLHEVYNGKLYGRGVGKTFLKIHTLAGLVEVSEMPIIFVLMDEWRDIYYLRMMIEKIFEEHKLTIHTRMNRGFMCNNKQIRFKLNNDLEKILGIYRMCDIIRMGHHN